MKDFKEAIKECIVLIVTLAMIFSSITFLIGFFPEATKGDSTIPHVRDNGGSSPSGFYGTKTLGEKYPEQVIYGDDKDQYLGTEVKKADFNRDSVTDIITNLMGYDDSNNAVVVFFGGRLNRYYDPESADIAFTGPKSDDFAEFFTLGDFNGDGRVDVAIASFGLPSAVYVYFGRSSWPSTLNTTSADLTIYGDDLSEIGYELSSGDINGDGLDDLIMTEVNINHFDRVIGIYGRSAYSNNTLLINASQYDFRINSTIPTYYGGNKWSLGEYLDICDITGDGFDDILMSEEGQSYLEPNDGVVMMVSGGLYLPKNIDLKNYPHFEFRGYQNYNIYGISHGDFNGDGINDVIVFSPDAFSGYGGAFIFYGYTYMISGNISIMKADLIIRGPSSHSNIGVKGIKDLDGDGKDEFLVTSSTLNSGKGVIYIIYESEFNSLLDNIYDMHLVTPLFTLSGFASGSYFGDFDLDNILPTDFNGDGIIELTVGMPGVKNSLIESEPTQAGAIYILHQIETEFKVLDFNITNQKEVEGIYVLGADYPYEMSYKIRDTWSRLDVHGITLTIEFSGIMTGKSVSLMWFPETMEFRKGSDINHYFEVLNAKSTYLDNYTWMFNISFILTHNITSQEPITIKISGRAGLDLTTTYIPSVSYKVEKDLELIGKLIVKGQNNGIISMGEYLHVDEMVEITGPKCVYAGTEDLYPLNSYFTVFYYDGYGNLYYDTNSSGKEIYFRYWVQGDNTLEYFNITIVNIPGGGEVLTNPISFYYFVDKTVPNPPLYITARADSEVDPLIGFDNDDEMYLSWEPVPDLDSGINGYYYSTEDHGGTEEGNFTTDTSAVIHGLKDGWNNIYVWAVDNAMNIGQANNVSVLIDRNNVIFYNPSSSHDKWFNSKFIQYRITIADPDGSGVEGRSIEYALSFDNGKTFGAWEPANIKRNRETIKVSVFLNLREGRKNAIKWRASDVAGNGPVESPIYPINVDTIPVTFKNPIPYEPSESKYVVLGITISDEKGSGVDGSSIQYQISRRGATNYGEWISSEALENKETITISTPPILFEKGTVNYVRWRAKDVAGNGYTYSDDIKVYILPEKINTKPVIIITSPSEQVYTTGKPIIFDASKTFDSDGQELSYLWISSIDGFLGTDSIVSRSLSVGTHTITLAVSDGIVNETKTFQISVYPDLSMQDTDGDGIPDIYDSDDDNDGLPDVVEDKNHNGIVDPGETDPKLPDSDFDGVSDSLDTAPLNPEFSIEKNPNYINIWILIILVVLIFALLIVIGFLYKLKVKKELDRRKLFRDVVRKKKALRRFEVLTGIPIADLPAVESIYPSLPGVVQATALTTTALPPSPAEITSKEALPPGEEKKVEIPAEEVKEEERDLPEIKIHCPICDTEVTIPKGELRAVCPLCGEEVKRP